MDWLFTIWSWKNHTAKWFLKSEVFGLHTAETHTTSSWTLDLTDVIWKGDVRYHWGRGETGLGMGTTGTSFLFVCFSLHNFSFFSLHFCFTCIIVILSLLTPGFSFSGFQCYSLPNMIFHFSPPNSKLPGNKLDQLEIGAHVWLSIYCRKMDHRTQIWLCGCPNMWLLWILQFGKQKNASPSISATLRYLHQI